RQGGNEALGDGSSGRGSRSLSGKTSPWFYFPSVAGSINLHVLRNFGTATGKSRLYFIHRSVDCSRNVFQIPPLRHGRDDVRIHGESLESHRRALEGVANPCLRQVLHRLLKQVDVQSVHLVIRCSGVVVGLHAEKSKLD